tara:strand:- start:341 stop:2878 length:2538 start_codon:yes stop_codon:yes gene_type:complete
MTLYSEYKQLCKEWPEHIVCYQNGNFYEVFEWENPNIGYAKTLSQVCDFQLTRRTKKEQYSDSNPHMSGFQISSRNKHAKTLVDAGYNVVFYIEKKEGKSISRIFDCCITPGTSEYSTDKQGLLTFFYGTLIGMTFINVTTGLCEVTEFDDPIYIDTYIDKYKPAEILYFSTDSKENCVIISPHFTKNSFHNQFLESIYPSSLISPIENIGLEKYPDASTCFVATLNTCQKYSDQHIQKLIKPTFIQDFCILHQNSFDQLNIQQLFKTINKTKTKSGKRLLFKQITRPFKYPNDITRLHQHIDKIKSTDINAILEHMNNVIDLDVTYRKLYLNKINLSSFLTFYESWESINNILHIVNSPFIDSYTNIYNYINQTFHKDGIKKGHNKKLDSLFKAKESLLERLEKSIECYPLTTGKKTNNTFKSTDVLKIVIAYDEENGDSLQVQTTPHRASQLKTLYKDLSVSQSGKTIASIMKNTEWPDIFHSFTKCSLQIYNIKQTIYNDFISFISENKDTLDNIAYEISLIDTIISRIKLENEIGYSRPIILSKDEGFLAIKNVRHPIIEHLTKETYIGNDISVDKGILLYGVNGSGKSCCAKSVACSIILAQTGHPVPADYMEISPFHHVFTRTTCDDNMFIGNSSFTNEMKELQGIYKFADPYTFILGDEICKGTEELSANAIVGATIQYLQRRKSKFIMTTHLHKLTDIKDLTKNCHIYHIGVKYIKNDIIFTRKIQEGQGRKIYGLEIAQKILNNKEFSHLSNAIMKVPKQSRYNNSYLGKCQICNECDNLEHHHIESQKDRPDKINSESNLVSLCSKCHDKVHNGSLKIIGWIRSTKGLLLDYETS